jgi:AraC family transcriptional regulator, glycine betaine-responsive activator
MTTRLAEPLRLAYLLTPQFSMMAFSAAIEPLRAANRISERQLFEWRLVSIDGEPVMASNGIPVAVHGPLEQVGKVDMVVVCMALEPLQFGRNHKVHHLLRRLARHGCRVGGISSGAFVLADAGLLTDRRCTVHWEYTDLFRSRYPGIEITQELFVVDRDVFTCSGGTAALDLMLHFVSEVSSGQLAVAVAEQFIHPHIRGQEDRQRMQMHERYGIESPKLVEVIHLMESTLDEPVDVAMLAQRVSISARQVERLFREHLGTSPKLFYLRLRMARAQMLLRQTLNPIREVAMECGFASTSHFSNAYKRVFGRAPTQERHRAARRSDDLATSAEMP